MKTLDRPVDWKSFAICLRISRLGWSKWTTRVVNRCHFHRQHVFLGQDSTEINGATIDKHGRRFLRIKVSRVVLVDKAAFRWSNDNCSSSVHCHFTPARVRCIAERSGDACKVSDKSWTNAAELRRLRTSDTLVGGVTLWQVDGQSFSWSWRNNCSKFRSWLSSSMPPM